MMKETNMRICVEFSEYCDHFEQEDGEYGSWGRSYSSTIDKVYKLKDKDNGPFNSETFLVPDNSSEVYVVYMFYDTGDSFGQETGRIDILHCSNNEESANKLAKYITDNSDEYTIKFVDDFGRAISIDNRGAGYFESITNIEVKRYHI